MANTSDVIVIGGGIMGCCVAFELAKRGHSVVLLEKGALGGGATGKSSAIIRQHYSNELTARMALHSLQVFHQFEELLGDECGFRPVGFLALAGANSLDGLKANVEMQQRLGISTELLSPEMISELVPDIDVSDVVAAAFEPESGYADPHLTVSGYANAGRRLGVKIVVDCRVDAIRRANEKVVGVDTNRGVFHAPLLVNCAGPWGAAVAGLAGVRLPIDACRVQVALFRHDEGAIRRHPVIVDFVNGTYFRPETGNVTLVGSIDPQEASAVVDPDGYAEYVDDDFVSDVGARVLSRYPRMAESVSAGGYAGLYAVTPDWHPIVDEVPSGSGHFVCTGFSGHGYKLGPAVGVMVAELVTQESSPTFAADAFRLNRFGADQQVRGRYQYSIVG